MLSSKKIICPNNLINVAKKTGVVDAAIVNAGEIFPMESVHKAVKHNLIKPIFIGNESEIKKYATKLEWDGKNEAGSIVESGIYVYQVKVGDVFSTGTVVLAK